MTRLTPRERQVCDMIVQGLSCKEIGRKLHSSHRTIEMHRGRILHKYEVRNAVELVLKVYNIEPQREVAE